MKEKKDLDSYIKPEQTIPEFTIQAAILGFILSIIFNAANAYLGLKIGMTVSASIPSAIISMAVLRIILPRLFNRQATILENNTVHAFASIGESLAAAIIFTVPALIFMGSEISNSKVFLLGLTGGILGLLMMIPLRYSLMIKEHKNLPFPEGSACAKVLIAGDKGGASAKPVFLGIFIGGIFKFFMSAFQLFKDTIMWTFPKLHKAGFGYEVSPLFLGVGYLVGLRISAIMFAGGAFGYWVLIPLIDAFGGSNIIAPGTIPISEMSTSDIRINYIRFIGAGGVAFGGLISVIKSLPDIFFSILKTLQSIKIRNEVEYVEEKEFDFSQENKSIIYTGAILGAIIGIFAFEFPWYIGPEQWSVSIRILLGVLNRIFVGGLLGAVTLAGIFYSVSKYVLRTEKGIARTHRDIPLFFIGMGVLGIFLLIWLLPVFDLNFIESLFVIIFCFFFVAVSARMVGLIGTTNQPVSGMTITALLSVTLLFIFLGKSPQSAKVAAIMAGAIICISISVSGDLSQDLKTAALIGATPWKVELAQVSGLLVSAVRSGFILLLLYWAYGFGAPTVEHPNSLEAPQAQLMAKLVEGATGGNLPWLLLLIGAGIGAVCELSGISALAFAIGLYLPITNWPMILLGGVISWFITKKRGGAPEEEHDAGALFSSGLIAGDALTGILIAGITVVGIDKVLILRKPLEGNAAFENILSTVMYLFLAFLLYFMAGRKRI